MNGESFFRFNLHINHFSDYKQKIHNKVIHDHANNITIIIYNYTYGINNMKLFFITNYCVFVIKKMQFYTYQTHK